MAVSSSYSQSGGQDTIAALHLLTLGRRISDAYARRLATKQSISLGEQYTPGELLMYGLTTVMQNASKTKSGKGLKPHHLTQRTDWPYNSQQILPHGPDDTICRSLDWLATAHPFVSAHILEALLVSGQYIWPLIALVVVKKRLLLDVLTKAPQHWSQYIATLTPGQQQDQYENRVMDLLSILFNISHLLWKVLFGYSNPAGIAYHLQDCQEDVLNSCEWTIKTVRNLDSWSTPRRHPILPCSPSVT